MPCRKRPARRILSLFSEVMREIQAKMSGSLPLWVRRKGWLYGIGAGILLLVCLAVAMWVDKSSYFFTVLALHPGMSSKDVQKALGEPYIDNLDYALLYQKSGIPTMLWIVFDHDKISDWYILEGPWKQGYSQYKVKKYALYRPSGTFTGPRGYGDIYAIETTIHRLDANGNPLPGSAPLE